MHELPDNVYTEEVFGDLLASSLISEDARHDTESGDADDAEGLELSSNPPSPLTPLPPWFESDYPDVDADPLLLSPSIAVAPEPAPANDTPTLTSSEVRRQERKKLYDKGKKKAKRQNKAATRNNLSPAGYVPKQATVKKHATFDKSEANWDAKNLNVAKGGWIGKRMNARRKVLGLDDLRKMKYRHVPWNGE